MTSSNSTLSATYTSPTSTHLFSSRLPPLPEPQSAQAKSEFLSALRAEVGKMQGDVNGFLTRKMEEDKQQAEGAADGGRKLGEEKEEEMYGEEDPENDG